ncbi:MAG: methyltransferase domain-containing protein [Bacteroidota bacterium]
MELFNELSADRQQAVEDFLTFIPIYESRRRIISLEALLRRHRKRIQGRVCMEAGPGNGHFTRFMCELGAEKVYGVENSAVLLDIARRNHPDLKQVIWEESDIRDYEPPEAIDLLFHEFYGSLVLDETMLALQDLAFSPKMIVPNGGRLWAMPLSEAEVMEQDESYQPSWKSALEGALISELFSGIQFRPTWEVFHWEVSDKRREFHFKLPEKTDFLAFCGEITHEGKKVLDMAWTHNWQVLYTPVCGSEFQLRFEYGDSNHTLVYFDWVK